MDHCQRLRQTSVFGDDELEATRKQNSNFKGMGMGALAESWKQFLQRPPIEKMMLGTMEKMASIDGVIDRLTLTVDINY